MLAAKYDIQIEPGAGFYRAMRFVSGDAIPATLLGAEVYGQVLLDYDDVTVADFSCGILSAADRTFYFSLPGTVTAAIPWGTYRYNLYCQFSDMEPIRLLYGKATRKA